ncbi:exosortase A [Falsiroseomonas bella]|uniref:exosortase A n=1 Tax=Falsiroseomonas bella TaxID=2184016 RepID=UPI001304E5E5|nr:exosortase A [Falsiroseomonas bella]
MSHSAPLAEPHAAPPRDSAQSAWPAAIALLVVGVIGLGILFEREVSAAVRIWETNEAYNHCWLIAPIAAWLAWSRRQRLAGLQPAPTPLFALLAIPVGAAWLVAERLGIMEGRQLTALALVLVFVLTVLGWRITRAMAAPLLYLFFLVPFGAFTVPLLQQFTTWFIDIGLDVIGIPHYVDDLIIETPAGTFLVAEACAGLRFLIAALAFGALYALVMFRSPGRRLAVLALAIVVPIVANGFRALGIVVLGSVLGSAEAAAADHIIYGWVFFSIVMLLLIVVGLPFREDHRPDTAPPPPARPMRAPRAAMLAVAALLAGGLASAAPATSLALQQAGARAPERIAVPLPPVEGCDVSADGATLVCGDLTVRAEAVIFPAQATWNVVSAERSRAAGLDDQDLLFSVRVPNGGTWRARQSRDRMQTVAIGLWLNGRPAGGGVRSRAEQAWNSLGGGQGLPVLIAVTIAPQQAEGAFLHAPRQRAVLEALLEAQGQQIAAGASSLSGRNRAPASELVWPGTSRSRG